MRWSEKGGFKLPIRIAIILDCNAVVQLAEALRKVSTDEEQKRLGEALERLS